jgi:acetolactate synthase-1/2/3 large subunit
MMRVSQVLSQIFKSWGIQHVFGIPGKSISPMMLDLDSEGIEFVLTRHEAGAGFAAAGYALGNKKLGIAMGTSGPGGTNLLTAAGQAKAYHLPLLIITGQPSAAESGKALGQDSSCFGTDLVKMFEPVTLFSARVERADLMSLYLLHAVEKAYSGVKGPVHLCLPFDVLTTMIPPFTMQLPGYIPHMISSNIEAVIPLLHEARRPMLFIGKGVMSSEAYEEVKIVAEFWGIPVIATPGGKGVFPSSHPLFLGNFGLGGSLEASEYMQSGVDLMIVIGTKLSDMSLSGFDKSMLPKQVIHFDYEATFISKSISVPTHFILGDAKHNLRKLIEMSGARRNDKYSAIAAEQILHNHDLHVSALLTGGESMKALRSALPAQSIVFGDDGSHTFYAIRDFAILESGTFYFDDVFGAMGHAIGYAIGAKLALPDRPIVCITGDGCFMMHGAEISTAVNNRIPVIFIVLNNGRLDMVDKGMSYNTGRSIGAIYEKPLDVTMFARSMGANGICCRTMKDIEKAVELGLASQALPTVIEVLVDPLEIPPILSRLLSLA